MARILVVEDDADIRICLYDILADNHQVDQATDGAQGLEMARAGHYDVIVSDYLMPELDGIEMTKQLLAEGIRVPVVFMTGASRARMPANPTGFRFLPKPFELADLESAIQECLTNPRPGRAMGAL